MYEYMFIYSNTRRSCQYFFSHPPIRSSEVVSKPWIMPKGQGVPRIKIGVTTAVGAYFRPRSDTGVG
jgi:hypothetical protein